MEIAFLDLLLINWKEMRNFIENIDKMLLII